MPNHHPRLNRHKNNEMPSVIVGVEPQMERDGSLQKENCSSGSREVAMRSEKILGAYFHFGTPARVPGLELGVYCYFSLTFLYLKIYLLQ